VLLDELEAASAELLGDHRSSSRRALNVVAGSVVQMVAHLGSRHFPGDK
jgi:hypothetical protein